MVPLHKATSSEVAFLFYTGMGMYLKIKINVAVFYGVDA